MMKVVSLLGFFGVVGILGVTLYYVTNPSTDIALKTKAATAVEVRGKLESGDLERCKVRFYLGCYKVEFEGQVYNLVEKDEKMKLAPFVNMNVVVSGESSVVGGKNALVVETIRSFE